MEDTKLMAEVEVRFRAELGLPVQKHYIDCFERHAGTSLLLAGQLPLDSDSFKVGSSVLV